MNKPENWIKRGEVEKVLAEFWASGDTIEAIASIPAVEGVTVQGKIVEFADRTWGVVFDSESPKSIPMWAEFPNGTRVKITITKEE